MSTTAVVGGGLAAAAVIAIIYVVTKKKNAAQPDYSAMPPQPAQPVPTLLVQQGPPPQPVDQTKLAMQFGTSLIGAVGGLLGQFTKADQKVVAQASPGLVSPIDGIDPFSGIDPFAGMGGLFS